MPRPLLFRVVQLRWENVPTSAQMDLPLSWVFGIHPACCSVLPKIYACACPLFKGAELCREKAAC